MNEPARYDSITTPSKQFPSHQPVTTAKVPLPGMSWPSILGGAFIAASMLAVLSILGAGFGLSVVSPWPESGVSVKTVGLTAAVWLLLTQAFAAALGGYVSGRLRTPWPGVHNHEVYFRDTAHGLIMWAVAVVLTLLLLSSATAKFLGGTAQAGLQVASTAGTAAALSTKNNETGTSTSYFVDRMLRTDRPAPEANLAAIRAEVARILVVSLQRGELSSEDKRYLTSVVAAQSGSTPSEAAVRVDQVMADATKAVADAQQLARASADTARKSLEYLAFWSVAALLTGAFAASYAAMLGGRQRDRIEA